MRVKVIQGKPHFSTSQLPLRKTTMKSVKANLLALPVKVRINTTDKNKNQWAEIIDARTGVTLHRGQPKHIKYVARKRYNVGVSF
jgi:hypothetical protein